MPVLLIVQHTSSPSLQEMLEATFAGATTDEVPDVEVRVRPALAATAVDVLEADGFIVGTPVNIGYISGALKHFFDQIYYPTLTAKLKAPFGTYLHGNNDASGALRAIEAITTGLGWQQTHAPVVVIGALTKQHREDCWDLGATIAATLSARQVGG